MWDWEPQEEPEEEWHSKISHEDQSEFIFPEPKPEPVPEPPAPTEPAPGSDANHPFGVDPHAGQDPLDSPEPSLIGEWLPRIQKFLSVPLNFYATIGVGLGILCGIIVAAVSWHITNPTGPYDLGSVTSTAVGLKGRLFTKWDKKLQYRLTFEPGIPEQIAGFSAAVESSPRPLSIGIQLTDPQGFVLCSKNILIKYDSRNAEPPEDQAGASAVASDPQVRSSEATLADAEEGVREQSKDVFANQFGSDGKVASITAQGDLSCSASAYENAVAWSFSPDFPSVAEQDALLNHLAEKAANASLNSPQAIAARRRAAAKVAANPPPKFFIEGEDAIVDYDASAGIIATRGGKTFTIDRAGTEAASLKGRDFPLPIHYRCDQFGNCTLISAGAGVQHTRLRK
ncbi:MAG: hypothetical protein ABR976_14470 [Terracidiphilus sp.]|jgi:hypothetical protein